MSVVFRKADFERLFPAYVRLSPEGRIVCTGSSLRRILGDAVAEHAFFDVFTVETPRRVTDITGLSDQREVTLAFRQDGHHFRLRGMVMRAGSDIFLLLGHIPDVDMAEGSWALTMEDFSPADGSMDLLVVNEFRRGLLQETKALVTELREKTAEAEALANVDHLTGLANRRGFFRRLEELLPQASHSGTPLTIGLIDLDGFKAVNDIFGHAAGDQLIQQSGERLRSYMPKSAVVGRIGGDEFGLIVPGEHSDEDLIQLGKSICALLAEPFSVRDGVARIGASIGFASCPAAGDQAGTLFERADYALYHSKQKRRGQPALFTADHENEIRRRAMIEQKLMEADEDEFHLVYQPIVHSESGAIHGLEALARWNSPTLGAIQPDVFIRSAEQIGCVTRLTRILLKKALRDARAWAPDVSLSFNLSVIDLASPETVEKIRDVVIASGFPAERLVFEITETAMMQDIARAKESLAVFTGMGIRIALDDFGTGYSSLSYLQQMPIRRLKIDGTFTRDLARRKDTRSIVESLIMLCENLDIQCVIEGVATERQAKLLSNMGAPYLQGYYFSCPLAQPRVLALLDHAALGIFPWELPNRPHPIAPEKKRIA